MMKKKDVIYYIVAEFKQLFKDELVSIILHDSFLLNHAKTRNTQQTLGSLLVVFKDDFDFLKYSTSMQDNKKLAKQIKNQHPLVFTKRELLNSCDIFPIEFYEIQETAQTLFGQDFISLVSIEDHNLRLQIESNLRRNVILLRQEYFYRNIDLGLLLHQSFDNFLNSAKNILRLRGLDVERILPRDIIVQLTSLYYLDLDIFFTIIRYVEKNKKLSHQELDILFHKYLSQLSKFVHEVDTLVP